MTDTSIKNPCPWRMWSSKEECRCCFCQIAALKRVLNAARVMKYQNHDLTVAVEAYDVRMRDE